MLDLRNASWWKFEIPYNIKKMLTDQVDLRVIADKLYKFKKIDNGTDKIEDDYIDNKYKMPTAFFAANDAVASGLINLIIGYYR